MGTTLESTVENYFHNPFDLSAYSTSGGAHNEFKSTVEKTPVKSGFGTDCASRIFTIVINFLQGYVIIARKSREDKNVFE